jgi:hypothetical protein
MNMTINLTKYELGAYILVVGASGRVFLHLNDGGEPGELIAKCESLGSALETLRQHKGE